MPLIHFAFGSLFRSGKKQEQIDSFIESILLPKSLMAFECPEFLPIINSPNAMVATSVRDTGDGGVVFDGWVPAPPVKLLPNSVWMVSFVDIPFKKLRKWSPLNHYGRLGVAFTNDFRRRLNVRNVYYYQYPNLAQDPLVISLNKTFNGDNSETEEWLIKEVIQYRKPARLWEEFNTLFSTLRLTKEEGGAVDIEQITYSRYPVGYNFESEKEARLVKSEDDRRVRFDEDDVLALLVPDEEAKETIEHTIDNNWSKKPQIIICPNLCA